VYNLVNPGTFEDIIEFALSELRRRGIFREKVEHEGMTTRGVLGSGKQQAAGRSSWNQAQMDMIYVRSTSIS
jgi:hypothetical protein